MYYLSVLLIVTLNNICDGDGRVLTTSQPRHQKSYSGSVSKKTETDQNTDRLSDRKINDTGINSSTPSSPIANYSPPNNYNIYGQNIFVRFNSQGFDLNDQYDKNMYRFKYNPSTSRNQFNSHQRSAPIINIEGQNIFFLGPGNHIHNVNANKHKANKEKYILPVINHENAMNVSLPKKQDDVMNITLPIKEEDVMNVTLPISQEDITEQPDDTSNRFGEDESVPIWDTVEIGAEPAAKPVDANPICASAIKSLCGG